MDSEIEETRDFDLTTSFQREWNRLAGPPDVGAFLKRFPNATAVELTDLLLLDIQRRGAGGQIVPVESYPCWDAIAVDPHLKWRVVEAELRQATADADGASPVEEFVARFPDFAERIRGWNGQQGETSSDSSFDETIVPGMTGTVAAGEHSVEAPDREYIGRYRAESVLGKGGFGTVYKAWDEDLQRHVAIKVPRPDRVRDQDDVELFLREARLLATLDHPRIVPVHDVGRTEDGLCYIVWKLVEGEDLRARVRREPLKHSDTVRIVAEVAAALDYAHERGLVHRDIKPANILLDANMQPMLIDFGLALKEQDPGTDESQLVGTPAYMSPEQARAEDHLVDGRSDIFSLGVVLFELLTGRKPFTGKSSFDIIEQVMTREVRGLRQLNDAISRELERICLQALSKRARDRYRTAADFAQDLFDLKLDTVGGGAVFPLPAGESGTMSASLSIDHPVQVVPRGLRSYDADDADFFLDLLPGSRSRFGLPESIQFWKNRIEETSGAESFRVGLIYGPSGCGKSSLVKAGLFPRLSADVVKIYIEATPDATETRVMNQLSKRCPEFSPELGLISALSAIRRGDVKVAGRKVLIVIDQFEQWLLHRTEFSDAALTRALRHCDGDRLQCILMVRDDFWLSISRFMLDLEIDPVPGRNSALVDLFEVSHARRILQSFGVAYGRLPANIRQMSRQQEQFLDRSVDALSRDGKVVSVQLAIFAEMVKDKDWTPTTLRSLGGIEGIGVTFLEETFVSSSAPREYRQHQEGARKVLNALLPQQDTDIKGHLRSAEDLQEAAGYVGRDPEFDQLIRILESELRVITHTDPLGPADVSEANEAVAGKGYFQLTHDFLVPALRNWLTQKQKETFRGRTRLRFNEQAEIWAARPETRRLPSMLDWLRFSFWVRNSERSDSQREMMKAATWVHLRNGSVTLALLVVAVLLSFEMWWRNRTEQFVEQLKTARTGRVLAIIDQFSDYTERAAPQLRNIVEISPEASDAKLHAELALVDLDPDLAEPLAERMLSIDAIGAEVILDRLAGHRREVRDFLWGRLDDDSMPVPARIRAAEAILNLYEVDSEDSHWVSHGPTFARLLTAAVAATPFPDGRQQTINTFRPVRDQMFSSLISMFEADARTTSNSVAFVLVDYAADEPAVIADLILQANTSQLRTLLAGGYPTTAEQEILHLELQRIEKTNEWNKDSRRTANAAIAFLAGTASPPDEVWRCFEFRSDPTLRVRLIHQCVDFGVPLLTLADHLVVESRSDVKSALAQTLGEYPRGDIDQPDDVSLRETLLHMIGTASDAESQASAEWLLRQWDDGEAIHEAFRTREKRAGAADSNQLISKDGSVFVSIDASTVPGIERAFAICNKEVSHKQLRTVFANKYFNKQVADSEECAASIVGFYEALYYCQQMNVEEEIPESEWCFKRMTKQDVIDGTIDYQPDVSKIGYRLPTVAEWRYANEGGTDTLYPFGNSAEFATKYCWLEENSGQKINVSGLIKPNSYGLFDMLGNQREWCAAPIDSKGMALLIGGSWGTSAHRLDQLSEPGRFSPQITFDNAGFRVVRTLPDTTAGSK